MNDKLYKNYKCQNCGKIKKVMVNHDKLPELWERCTDNCMWDSFGLRGPILRDINGNLTGFAKRKHVLIQS